MIRNATLTLLAALFAVSAYAQTNVAVVDFEAVISRSIKARNALGQVGLFRKQKEDELKAMVETFQQKQRDANTRAADMSDAERRAATSELQRMQTDIKRATEDAEREVQSRTNAMLEQFNKEIGPLVSQVATEQGIQLVLQVGADLGVVFRDESIDITDAVVALYDGDQ